MNFKPSSRKQWLSTVLLGQHAWLISIQVACYAFYDKSSFLHSHSLRTFNALSYVHMVMALTGADLTKPTPRPRYNPLQPSLSKIAFPVPKMLLLYTGILPPANRPKEGPCTCSRFLITSKGNTPILANTPARTPEVASPEPKGSDRFANGGRRVSYALKNKPM